jgi:hypothetical protein
MFKKVAECYITKRHQRSNLSRHPAPVIPNMLVVTNPPIAL